MKPNIWVILLGLLLLPLTSLASGKNKKEVSFDEMLVKGDRYFKDELPVTVEQDKVLDALLGIRKEFRDRIEKSAMKN